MAKLAFSPICWLLLAVFLRSVNQVIMKQAALTMNDSVMALFTTALPLAIVFILLLRAFAWQKALKTYPLSFVYPFSSLALLALLFIGYVFYGEKISLYDLVSMMFIMFGIFIMTRDSKTKVEQ